MPCSLRMLTVTLTLLALVSANVPDELGPGSIPGGALARFWRNGSRFWGHSTLITLGAERAKPPGGPGPGAYPGEVYDSQPVERAG